MSQTPRCDAERYESGPTAANYGIDDPDIVVDYTFAQKLELELAAMESQRDELLASTQWVRTTDRYPAAGSLIVKRWDHNGAVWAGVFHGSAKEKSFDEWLLIQTPKGTTP